MRPPNSRLPLLPWLLVPAAAVLAQSPGAPGLEGGLVAEGHRRWLGSEGSPRDRTRAEACYRAIDQALSWYRKGMEAGDAEARAAYQRLTLPPLPEPDEEP